MSSADGLRTLATGLQLPEGPIGMSDGTFLVCEVLGGCVSRIHADGRREVLARPGGGPNGAAIGPDGRVYVCNNGGITPAEIAVLMSDAEDATDPGPPSGRIEVIDPASGAFSVLYSHCDGTHLVAPNDLIFDAGGGFYFTDFGSLKVRRPQPGAVYYARPDGSAIARVAAGLERANGVGLSADGRTLYVAETYSGSLWAFDVIAPGVLARGTGTRCGGRLLYRDPQVQFDSLAVDAEGFICVATTHRGSVARIAPDGSECTHFDVPGQGVTNVCFAGPDLRTAAITEVSAGVLLAIRWPCPGLPLHFLNE
ncbi:MAG: SMP-30/gluconolactonase/LRE family protein [Gammaproteobacteria bacterium]